MKNQSVDFTYYMIPLTRHFGKREIRDNKKIVVARSLGGGKKIEWVEHGIFRAVKLFCMIL